jgi:hypothetical protein
LKTVFELIEENGLTLHGDIEHFAALVIANHPPQSYMTWQEGYEAGKLAERARLQAFMRQMLDAYSLPSDPSGLRARSST